MHIPANEKVGSGEGFVIHTFLRPQVGVGRGGDVIPHIFETECLDRLGVFVLYLDSHICRASQTSGPAPNRL